MRAGRGCGTSEVGVCYSKKRDDFLPFFRYMSTRPLLFFAFLFVVAEVARELCNPRHLWHVAGAGKKIVLCKPIRFTHPVANRTKRPFVQSQKQCYKLTCVLDSNGEVENPLALIGAVNLETGL